MDDIDQAIDLAVEILKTARNIAAFTGAGISAESGLSTFRGSGGLWEGYHVEEVASPEGFARNPELVWRFYSERRRLASEAKPNAAHLVLADWEDRFNAVSVITQNVDGLHIEAGSRIVYELHGTLWKSHCSQCRASRVDRSFDYDKSLPRCTKCGGLERPSVVWFGEGLQQTTFLSATQALMNIDVLLVIGTSAQVFPAAGLVQVAARSRVQIIEVNPEPTLERLAAVCLPTTAVDALTKIDDKLKS